MGEEVRVKWKGKSRGIMTMIMALIEIEETEVSIHLIAPPIGKVSLPTPSLIMNMTRIIVTKEKIEEEGTIPKVVVPIDTTKAQKELKNSRLGHQHRIPITIAKELEELIIELIGQDLPKLDHNKGKNSTAT